MLDGKKSWESKGGEMVYLSFWDFERWSVGWMTLMVWVPRKNRGVVGWDVGIMDGDVKRISFTHFVSMILGSPECTTARQSLIDILVDPKQLISFWLRFNSSWSYYFTSTRLHKLLYHWSPSLFHFGNWKSPPFLPKNVSQELVRSTGWGRQRFGEVFDAAGSQETLHCWATPAAPMADDPSVPKKGEGLDGAWGGGWHRWVGG